jgi:hypothetical protein
LTTAPCGCCVRKGTPYGAPPCIRAPLPAEPAPRVPQHPPDEMPDEGRQPGHHTTPAFARERAPRPPTPVLLPWTRSSSPGRQCCLSTVGVLTSCRLAPTRRALRGCGEVTLADPCAIGDDAPETPRLTLAPFADPPICPDAVRERNPVHTVDQLAEAVRRVGGARPVLRRESRKLGRTGHGRTAARIRLFAGLVAGLPTSGVSACVAS